jgi:hypothetical protein
MFCHHGRPLRNRMRLQKTSSGYGELQQVYWIRSRRQTTEGGPSASGFLLRVLTEVLVMMVMLVVVVVVVVVFIVVVVVSAF